MRMFMIIVIILNSYFGFDRIINVRMIVPSFVCWFAFACQNVFMIEKENGMKQDGIVWSNLDVQKQHDRAMVTAQDLWPHKAVNHFGFEIFRYDCVVQTPSDILFAISTHVRPESVCFIFICVQVTECVDETKRK